MKILCTNKLEGFLTEEKVYETNGIDECGQLPIIDDTGTLKCFQTKHFINESGDFVVKEKLITEKEYRNHIKFHEELIELIISKTTQLSLMLYNKPPKGIFTSLDDLDEKDGKICVQFESYSCGESDYDTYYLPLEFLFDESYPEKYKLIWEKEKRKEKEERERKKIEEKENYERKIEDFERKTYERLKLKFEKSSNLLDVDRIWDKDDNKI